MELNKVTSFAYDSFDSFFEDLIKSKYSNEFDYIGISVLFTPAYESILILSKLSKNIFPDSFLLVGGNFPTAMYRSILNDSSHVDAVCYGEGEKPLLDLILASDKDEYLEKSSSWINHKN